MAKHEVAGKDFNIEYQTQKNSNVIVIAPHGGGIEKNTSRITKHIASNDFSYYCFNGTKVKGNRALHITSHNFDEPQCLELLSTHNHVIAIHGFNEKESPKVAPILIGGKDSDLISKLETALIEHGFELQTTDHKFSGTDANNVCNRGKTGAGVQFELSGSFREDMDIIKKFSETVRSILLSIS